jgi:hypothetical protein
MITDLTPLSPEAIARALKAQGNAINKKGGKVKAVVASPSKSGCS